MDDNCGEWVECMGVASGCGEQEVGVASGRGCGCKEVYRFPHTTFLLLLYLFFFTTASLLFVHFVKCFYNNYNRSRQSIFIYYNAHK